MRQSLRLGMGRIDRARGKDGRRGPARGLLLFALLAGTATCATKSHRDPDQSYVRYQLGVEYFQGRRIEAAIEELDKALVADPENSDAHNMLGIIALRQGHDYLEQAETAACLVGRDGDSVRQDANQRFREAENHLRTAVKFRPEFAAAWNNLAVAALALGEWDVAIDSASQALKDSTYSEPESARANLGWAYLQRKELQKAWKELHESVARAPKYCVGRYRLGKVFFERGDMEQAADTLTSLLDDVRCPIQDAVLLGALVAQKRGERDRARTLFEKCTQMAPRSCIANQCRKFVGLIR